MVCERERCVPLGPVLPELLGRQLGPAPHERHHRDRTLVVPTRGLRSSTVQAQTRSPISPRSSPGSSTVAVSEDVEGLSGAVATLIFERVPNQDIVTHDPVQRPDRPPDRDHHLLRARSAGPEANERTATRVMTDAPVIIESALNGITSRRHNASVPVAAGGSRDGRDRMHRRRRNGDPHALPGSNRATGSTNRGVRAVLPRGARRAARHHPLPDDGDRRERSRTATPTSGCSRPRG